MHIHILQHVYFEGLGSIAPWLDEHSDIEVSWTRFHDGEALPALDDIDWIIVLGGPMSVHDESDHPWLADEKHFVAEAIERNCTVLGVCLGAQLVATALGAQVKLATSKEIGWFPVFGEDVEDDLLACPYEVEAFHWHGETFDLPEGAVRLAHSKACRNQAFRFGDRVLALQFHLETTPDSASNLIAYCGHELDPAPHVQDALTLRAVPTQNYANINRWMSRVLDALAHVTRH